MLLEKLQQSAGLVHLLDLKHSDIRMDLVKTLRNEGVKYFIVDVGSNLLHNFFDQAMKSGIVHAKMSFLSSSLVIPATCLEYHSNKQKNIVPGFWWT